MPRFLSSVITAVSRGTLGESHTTGSRESAERGAYLLQIGLLAFAYYVSAEIGLSAGALKGNVTPVWPPTGLALAALVLFGRRLWPGVAIGAILVNGLSAVPFAAACGMTVGNTLEAVIGASLLRFVPGFRPSLDRVSDVVAVAVLSAGLSTTVSASVGVLSLRAAGVIAPGAFWTTWRVWWVGDALGVLVIGAAVLVWADPNLDRFSTKARLGGLVIVVAAAGVTLAAFSGPLQYLYLVFPLLVWAALLGRQPGATAATLVVSGTAVLLTADHIGSFAKGGTTQSLWRLDTFLAVVAVTMLLLAAVVSERDRADHEAAILAEQLRDQANTDGLTGLANRRSFEHHLERHVAHVARYGPAGAVLVLDLDHFKQINDSLGHRAGDEVIISVADVLRTRLRDTDIIARLGGDEFAIILPHADQTEADLVAGVLVELVAQQVSVRFGDDKSQITLSVGVAPFDTPGLSGEDMLMRADLAMYQAKQAGGHRSEHHQARPTPRQDDQPSTPEPSKYSPT